MPLDPATQTALINLAIQEAPSVINLIKGLFAKTNPGAAVPTDADVIAAFEAAFKSSLAIDEKWLIDHQDYP